MEEAEAETLHKFDETVTVWCDDDVIKGYESSEFAVEESEAALGDQDSTSMTAKSREASWSSSHANLDTAQTQASSSIWDALKCLECDSDEFEMLEAPVSEHGSDYDKGLSMLDTLQVSEQCSWNVEETSTTEIRLPAESATTLQFAQQREDNYDDYNIYSDSDSNSSSEMLHRTSLLLSSQTSTPQLLICKAKMVGSGEDIMKRFEMRPPYNLADLRVEIHRRFQLQNEQSCRMSLFCAKKDGSKIRILDDSDFNEAMSYLTSGTQPYLLMEVVIEDSGPIKNSKEIEPHHENTSKISYDDSVRASDDDRQDIDSMEDEFKRRDETDETSDFEEETSGSDASSQYKGEYSVLTETSSDEDESHLENVTAPVSEGDGYSRTTCSESSCYGQRSTASIRSARAVAKENLLRSDHIVHGCQKYIVYGCDKSDPITRAFSNKTGFCALCLVVSLFTVFVLWSVRVSSEKTNVAIEDLELRRFFDAHHLEEDAERICDRLGLKMLSHLSYVSEPDIEALGLKPVQRNALLRAVAVAQADIGQTCSKHGLVQHPRPAIQTGSPSRVSPGNSDNRSKHRTSRSRQGAPPSKELSRCVGTVFREDSTHQQSDNESSLEENRRDGDTIRQKGPLLMDPPDEADTGRSSQQITHGKSAGRAEAVKIRQEEGAQGHRFGQTESAYSSQSQPLKRSSPDTPEQAPSMSDTSSFMHKSKLDSSESPPSKEVPKLRQRRMETNPLKQVDEFSEGDNKPKSAQQQSDYEHRRRRLNVGLHAPGGNDATGGERARMQGKDSNKRPVCEGKQRNLDGKRDSGKECSEPRAGDSSEHEKNGQKKSGQKGNGQKEDAFKHNKWERAGSQGRKAEDKENTTSNTRKAQHEHTKHKDRKGGTKGPSHGQAKEKDKQEFGGGSKAQGSTKGPADGRAKEKDKQLFGGGGSKAAGGDKSSGRANGDNKGGQHKRTEQSDDKARDAPPAVEFPSAGRLVEELAVRLSAFVDSLHGGGHSDGFRRYMVFGTTGGSKKAVLYWLCRHGGSSDKTCKSESGRGLQIREFGTAAGTGSPIGKFRVVDTAELEGWGTDQAETMKRLAAGYEDAECFEKRGHHHSHSGRSNGFDTAYSYAFGTRQPCSNKHHRRNAADAVMLVVDYVEDKEQLTLLRETIAYLRRDDDAHTHTQLRGREAVVAVTGMRRCHGSHEVCLATLAQWLDVKKVQVISLASSVAMVCRRYGFGAACDGSGDFIAPPKYHALLHALEGSAAAFSDEQEAERGCYASARTGGCGGKRGKGSAEGNASGGHGEERKGHGGGRGGRGGRGQRHRRFGGPHRAW